MRRIVLTMTAALLSILGAADLTAQFGLDIYYGAVSDGNTFRNYENYRDLISQPELSLHYDFRGTAGYTRLFYNGSATLFNELTARHFSMHYLGLAGERRFGEFGLKALWGLQSGRRINREDYRYYDFSQTEGYLHLKLDNSSKSHWLMGLRATNKTYSELPEFSHTEALLHLRTSLFLRTRSTIIMHIQAGYKHFLENTITEETIQETVPNGQSRQQGRGNPNGNGNGNSNNNNTTTVSRTVTVESTRPSVWQLAASLRIAQAMMKKTGLALQLDMKRNPSGAARVLSGQDSGYDANDDLYDDPYSYDLDETALELTQLLPWSCRLKAGWSLAAKNYDRPAYDLQGNTLDEALRKDRVETLWIRLNKTMPVKNVSGRIDLSISVIRLDNDSNDAYFRYDNTIASLGVDFSM